MEILAQGLGEDADPFLFDRQLLRTLAEILEELGDPGEGADDVAAAAVAGGDREAGPAGVAGLAGDAVQQQRPAGDSFEVIVGVGYQGFELFGRRKGAWRCCGGPTTCATSAPATSTTVNQRL